MNASIMVNGPRSETEEPPSPRCVTSKISINNIVDDQINDYSINITMPINENGKHGSDTRS